jgi:esterase/lipase superfamily enzyme
MRALRALLVVILALGSTHLAPAALAQERGWLGLKVDTVTPALAAARKLNVQFGAVVLEVESGSPAAKANLRAGDVVVSVNGRAVIDKNEFESAVGGLAPGAKVEIVRLRERETARMTIVLARRPPPPPPPAVVAAKPPPPASATSPPASGAPAAPASKEAKPPVGAAARSVAPRPPDGGIAGGGTGASSSPVAPGPALRSSPKASEDRSAAIAPPSQPQAPTAPRAMPIPPVGAPSGGAAPPAAEAARDATGAGAPAPQASVSRPAEPLPEPKPGERLVPFGGGFPSLGGRPRGAAGSDGAAAPAVQWDVVPVFYGTDRVGEPQAERASYTSGRGKRLELGRALITVPKSHEVPQVERPWAYHLPFTSIVLYREREDPNRHFTLKEVRRLTEGEFLSLVRERIRQSQTYKDHALVFVHGFNTTFDNALFRTAQMAYDLQFDGAPFLYSWPSSGQVGLQDYSYDRESTGQSEPYFRQFLELVTRQTGAKSVSLIAHSMGNQLLLAALRDIKRNAPPGVVVSEVILAAPDVDRDTFEFVAKEIKGVSRGITLLAASNDRALEISRQFWGGVPRAGDVPAAGPVIVPGVDTIDITTTSTSVFSLNHSGYAEQPMLLGDIRTLLRLGERPLGKAMPSLELVKTDKGSYWRYPAPAPK